MGGEAAGNAEADHAAVTLPHGAVGNRRQLASGRAADDQDAGTRGDAGLEVQTDECDNEATRVFDSSIGKPTRVVTLIHQFVYESTAGEIQLGCHKKPFAPRVCGLTRHAPKAYRADVLGFFRLSPSLHIDSTTIQCQRHCKCECIQ